MTLLDGKKIAQKILGGLKEEIKAHKKQLRLAVVVVGQDAAVRSFIEQKKKAAQSIGIDVRLYPFDASITTNELRKRIAEIVHEKKNSGVIVQLPLPEHINKQYILNAIVAEKDVDVLAAKSIGNFAVGKHAIMPPVAGAIKAILEEYKIDYLSLNTVIVGAGSLVGRPVALWLMDEGASFALVTKKTANPQKILQQADIVISGIGEPRYISGDMVKDGVVMIDAGTSESGGEILGDADFDTVSPKSSFITPVPGGVGPVTVAMLLKNVVTLAKP